MKLVLHLAESLLHALDRLIRLTAQHFQLQRQLRRVALFLVRLRLETNGTLIGNKRQILIFKHLIHKGFGTRVLCFNGSPQMHVKVQIVPHVVIVLNMQIETSSQTIKAMAVHATYEALALDVLDDCLILASKLTKRVNDDTEKRIKQNQDANDPERRVVQDSQNGSRFLPYWRSENVTNSTPVPQTLV